MMSWQE